MKTKSKALLLAISAVAIVIASVFGTLAYLTDTDTVTNTFTVGQVHIKLDEAPVDANGKKTDGDRVTANSYKLFPGQTYDKDPMVTIEKDSSEAYIRMIVKVSNINELKAAFSKYQDWFVKDGTNEVFLLQNLVSWKNNAWEYEKYQEQKINDAVTEGYYEFRYIGNYCKTVEGIKQAYTSELEEGTTLEPLFETITIPGTLDNDDIEHLNNMEIEIVAHAIQAAGFEEDVNAAWSAFDGQYGLMDGIVKSSTAQ